MKRTPARRSSLFLLECIIAILFFILAATVCVRFFAKSYSLSKESEDLTMAVHIVSSYAEEFRAENRATASSERKLYFDNNWTACDEAKATHTLTITITTNDDIVTGHFQMDDIFETALDIYVANPHEGGTL